MAESTHRPDPYSGPTPPSWKTILDYGWKAAFILLLLGRTYWTSEASKTEIAELKANYEALQKSFITIDKDLTKVQAQIEILQAERQQQIIAAQQQRNR